MKQRIVHGYIRTVIFFDFLGQWNKKLVSYSYEGLTFYARPNTSDKFVFREVWKHRTYAHPKVVIPRDGVVLDVGANIGVFSMYAAKYASRVLAIEALPENYELLQKNIASNSLHNVEATNIALVDKERKTPVFAEKNNLGGSSIYEKTHSGEEVIVEGISLETFISRNQIDHIDMMKMDVEGAEYEILLNTNSLSKISSIAMEFHDDGSQEHEYMELVEKLEREGFSVEIPTPKWWIRFSGLGRLFAWK